MPIPPKGSIPPNVRQKHKIRTDSTMRRTISGQMGGPDQTWQNDFNPIAFKPGSAHRPTTAPIITMPIWPDRAEPDVIEHENRVWVIVAFPRHKLNQVEWQEQGDMLSVRSKLVGCPYENQIALPQDRGERVDIKLNNGLLVVTFEKQYPS